MSATSFPAVVTAAGAATRFYPFSRCVPKEMLPIGAAPAVEHVILECLAAGASEVIVVTRPGDSIVPDYVHHLRRDGAPVETVEEDLGHGYGNATPLLTLRSRLEGCDRFAVAFGDDLLLGEPTRGANLTAMYLRAETSEAVIAGQIVPIADVGSFGVIDTDRHYRDLVTAIRQRPHPDTVDEPLAVVSRLILHPGILDRLAPTKQACGEVDLGVAIGDLATTAHVVVHRIDGRWVTVGDPRHYVDALRTYWNLHETELTKG